MACDCEEARKQRVALGLEAKSELELERDWYKTLAESLSEGIQRYFDLEDTSLRVGE